MMNISKVYVYFCFEYIDSFKGEVSVWFSNDFTIGVLVRVYANSSFCVMFLETQWITKVKTLVYSNAFQFEMTQVFLDLSYSFTMNYGPKRRSQKRNRVYSLLTFDINSNGHFGSTISDCLTLHLYVNNAHFNSRVEGKP